MLRPDRQRKIKEWIFEEKSIRISELSERLGVSEMTIHRDLRPLIEEGIIAKTFGGIMLVESSPSLAGRIDACSYCVKKVHERLAYRLIISNQKVETACCAHCGLLRQQQLGKKVKQALCQDFLLQTTISAPSAWFVMDTTLDVGCCQPQVLTFAQRTHAESFVKGFAGAVYSFEEAMHKVNQVISRTSCDHSS